MRIKNIVTSLSIVLSITVVGGLLPTTVANAASSSYAMNPSISTNKVLTPKETSQVESEINVLKNCHIDTSIINGVDVAASGNEYNLKYKDRDEKVKIKNNDTKGVTLIVSDGKIRNEILFEKDGSIIIDGNKVQIYQVPQADQMNTNLAVTPYGTIYKSVKSFDPYPGFKPSDYNQYLTSGIENIFLGQAIATLTTTAFTSILALIPYFGPILNLVSYASAVKSVIEAANPDIMWVGKQCVTWTCGTDDYQYYSYFYPNTACTGSTYKLVISYEHFTVY